MAEPPRPPDTNHAPEPAANADPLGGALPRPPSSLSLGRSTRRRPAFDADADMTPDPYFGPEPDPDANRSGPPFELVIRFNESRGQEEEALKLARRLFATYDTAIDSLTLVPLTADDPEDLALDLNGRELHSQTATGKPPLVAHVRAALAAADGSA